MNNLRMAKSRRSVKPLPSAAPRIARSSLSDSTGTGCSSTLGGSMRFIGFVDISSSRSSQANQLCQRPIPLVGGSACSGIEYVSEELTDGVGRDPVSFESVAVGFEVGAQLFGGEGVGLNRSLRQVAGS